MPQGGCKQKLKELLKFLMLNEIFIEINNNREWRLEELREYQNIIANLSASDNIEAYDRRVKIILKSMLPMIYAHWEGFVKYSIEMLFRYLNQLQLPSSQYNGIFLATAYEQDLSKTPDIINFEKRVEHLNCLYSKFASFVCFESKIDTEANLNFKVLSKICKRLNINASSFDTYSSELNKLLEFRNKIVHGENSLPFEDYDQIVPFIELLENLMLDFQVAIQELIQDEKYKRCENESV